MKFNPTLSKEGNRVFFGKYSGIDIESGGESVLIMKQEDILAVITE